ncbi:hypothetical protein [Salinimicrobium sp. GXAS 041]|uniref:hypothetical protein n=1 Tax=Salinimicrobium sp. GXAS 041 TaxID=3400806 RepID=UPI003C73B33D
MRKKQFTQLVKAHKGRLSVESSKENGTAFEIVIPKYRNKPGKTNAVVNFE